MFPGVLSLEAIAQAAAVLARLSLGKEAGEDTVYLFAGIDNARFKRTVEPGDQMVIDVRMIRRKRSIWRCGGEATVDGKLCTSMELLFTYQNLPS